MDTLADLQAELQALMADVWPDIVVPGGSEPSTFWTEIQAYEVNFIETASRALGGVDDLPEPPYTVLQFGTKRNDPQWGVANHQVRVPIRVFRIYRKGDMDQLAVDADLERFRTVIDARGATFETFQRIERGEVDSSADSPLNLALLVDAATTFICGHVGWDPGLLA